MNRASQLQPRIVTYAELRTAGLTRRQIDREVAAERLLRVRRGRYVEAGSSESVIRAAKLGGRLDCVSLLRELGVFVLDDSRFHVAVATGSSRLGAVPAGVVRHWKSDLTDASVSTLTTALAQACRCQTVRATIATLDSAWHLGIVDECGIAEVFSLLPARYKVLRKHLDRRAESGSETLMRLLLRRAGIRFEPQVWVDGVGRVDFVVDGWLIVECDSKEFHADWRAQRKDYRRNIEAARRGYATLRVTAEDIMYRPDDVLEALRGAVNSRRRGQNSSRPRSFLHGTRPSERR